MLSFFNTTVANAKGALSAKFGDAKGALSAKLSDANNAAKTKLSDALSVANSAAKTKLSDIKSVLSDALKNPKIQLIEIVENQIKEIDAFLANKKVELDAFIENHTKVANVIIKIKKSLTDETGDTNRSVECSYYETYEDIGNNKITTEELTLQEVEKKKALQIGFCVRLFKENEDLLASLHKIRGSIGENIIELLITNDNLVRPKNIDIYFDNVLDALNTYLTDNNNKPQEISVERFAELRNKLTNQSNTLRNYILPKCVSEPYKRLVRTVGGGSYKKTKGTKKINALNRGMRGGGIYDVISANALIVKVDNQITVLKAFEQRQSQNIIELDMLIYKREKLYNVIKGLNANINALNQFYDTSQTPYTVDYSYYKKYEDIGDDIIVKGKGEARVSVIQDTINLQIDICETLFKEIKKIQDSITVEDRTAITDYIKSVNLNINELYSSINSVSQFSTKAYLIGQSHETIKSKLEKRKQTLLDYLKKLNYFIDTSCKYKRIEKIPPSDPLFNQTYGVYTQHTQHTLHKGGGSYKKTNKKNILGKERCIYKKSGDRKEYIKYKGNFIAVREYKKLLKTR